MLDNIIGDDNKSREEFDAYLEVWEKSAGVKEYEEIDPNSDWQKVKARMNRFGARNRIPVRTYFLRIAAILILAVGLAVFLAKVVRVSESDAVYTEFASYTIPREVKLDDGSVITLNKGSKLVYNSDFGTVHRDLILEGEAFFDVARNEKIPFKIHTANTVIEVLGTQFDVKSDSMQVMVGVVSGKVALYESVNTENRIELEANNTGYFDRIKNSMHATGSFDPNTIAWQTKQFIFNDLPLEEVCNVLADFYDLQLLIGEEVEFNESLYLNCSTESIDDVLFAVNKALVSDVKLYRNENLLIVRSE